MTSDLLFSILPREGKVPIAHDSQKVVQIDKQEAMRALSDEEKELKGEEKEARKQQQQRHENEQSAEQQTTPEPDEHAEDEGDQKKPRGPKHLDIYV